MKSKKESFLEILMNNFSRFAFFVLTFVFLWLAISHNDLYWAVLSFLMLVFLYFDEALYGYRKCGIDRWLLSWLGLSCGFVIVFYACIYGLFGFSCDGKLYLYGTAPFNISRFWDAIYFSAVTFTTLGYGDCKPIPELRLVCASEAIVGYMYLGILVGCVMTYLAKRAKYQEQQQERKILELIRKPKKNPKIYNSLFIPEELLEKYKQELLEKQTKRRHRRFNMKTSKNKLKCNKK